MRVKPTDSAPRTAPSQLIGTDDGRAQAAQAGDVGQPHVFLVGVGDDRATGLDDLPGRALPGRHHVAAPAVGGVVARRRGRTAFGVTQIDA